MVFIAHAPAGFLVSRLLGRERAVATACVVGSLFPDLDMLWWWFIDHGAVHHHRYWTHVPLFWLCLAAVLIPATRQRWIVAFFVGVLTHLVLDTLVGDIAWLLPFSDRFVHLVEVPASPGAHWIASFVGHWTFAVEIALFAIGMIVAVRTLRGTCSRATSRNSSSASSAPSTSPASRGSSGA